MDRIGSTQCSPPSAAVFSKSPPPVRVNPSQCYIRITLLTLSVFAGLVFSQKKHLTPLKVKRLFNKIAIGLIQSGLGRRILLYCDKLYIAKAYTFSEHTVYVDMIRSTLAVHARVHIKAFAEQLRKAEFSLYHLGLQVTYRNEKHRGDKGRRDFATQILLGLLEQESVRVHPLFKISDEGYCLNAEREKSLAEDERALCENIGTVLGAWVASPLLQEYKLGHLFSLNFYIEIAALSSHEEWFTVSYEELPQADKNQMCLELVETTLCHALNAILYVREVAPYQLKLLWNALLATDPESLRGRFPSCDQFEQAMKKNTCDTSWVQCTLKQVNAHATQIYKGKIASLHALAKGFRVCPRLREYSAYPVYYAAQSFSHLIQGDPPMSKNRGKILQNIE